MLELARIPSTMGLVRDAIKLIAIPIIVFIFCVVAGLVFFVYRRKRAARKDLESAAKDRPAFICPPQPPPDQAYPQYPPNAMTQPPMYYEPPKQ